MNSPGIVLSIAACLWVILFIFVEYGGHIDPPNVYIYPNIYLGTYLSIPLNCCFSNKLYLCRFRHIFFLSSVCSEYLSASCLFDTQKYTNVHIWLHMCIYTYIYMCINIVYTYSVSIKIYIQAYMYIIYISINIHIFYNEYDYVCIMYICMLTEYIDIQYEYTNAHTSIHAWYM